MDFAIEMDSGGNPTMTLTAATDRRNNVYLSLAVQRGSFFQNPNFGSRFYLLRRAKVTDRTEGLVRDYAYEALEWLVTTGRARAVDVATAQRPGGIEMQVTVWWGDQQPAVYTHFVEVI